MSASREKKQRQDLLSQGPTQRQIKEQKEAAARKKKTVVYTIIGVVIAIAVIALLVWNSGIFQRRQIAATVGDTKLTVAEMQYYYATARQSELYNQQIYQVYYGVSIRSDPYNMYDSSSELGDGQVYNTETGQTYAQFFEESALSIARETIVLTTAARSANYQLSADGQKQIDDEMQKLKDSAATSNYPNVNAYLSALYGQQLGKRIYVTDSVYKSLVADGVLASEYLDHYEASLTYSNEDYDAYARENPTDVYSYNYRYAYISGAAPSKTDEEGKTVAATDEEKTAAMEAAKAKADAMVAGVKAASGDKSDAFNELVVDAVGETSSYADPDYNLQSGVLGNNLTSSYYYDWLTDTSRVKGDVTSVESPSGYWVVLFLDRYLNNADTVDVRHILVKADLPVDDPDTPDVDESKNLREDDPATEDFDESKVPNDDLLAAAKAEAEAILAEFEAGEKTEDAFAALANEKSDDTGSNTKGGLYPYVEEDTMVPEFNDWIFDASRQPGDTGIVGHVGLEASNYYGYHVMYFVKRNGPKWHEVADEALHSDDIKNWVEELQAPYEAAAADGMSLVH